MKLAKFKYFFLFLLIFSCSSISNKENSDFFYLSKIKGLKAEEYTPPHALPLFIIYIDYIKNNRCKGRKDLFNFYFDQFEKNPKKIQIISEKVRKNKALFFQPCLTHLSIQIHKT